MRREVAAALQLANGSEFGLAVMSAISTEGDASAVNQ